MNRLWRRPHAKGFALIVVSLLFLAGAAYAGMSALAQTDLITACKNRANGSVRIVDNASECRSQEEVVTWGQGGLSTLEYVTAGPNSASQQAVEAQCSPDLYVLGGAVKNRNVPGTIRASYPSDGSGNGTPGARGWYGIVDGGSGPFSVYAICAPAGSIETTSSGGQYGGGQYGG